MYSPQNTENGFTPSERKVFDAMVAAVRLKHESWKTGQAYGHNVVRYVRFLRAHPEIHGQPSEEKVRAYLTHLAPNVAAKTQNQHLCAVKRYYEEVLRKPLGVLGSWAFAKRPETIPVWLNQDETRRLLGLLSGTHALMGRVCYGSGLRLMELMRLRQQHIDLEKRTLFIMGAKGQKARTVPLAASVVADLAAHIERVRKLWLGDQANGYPPVALPDGLERKYPNAWREWSWFWVWPGRNLSRDPETGIVRRHHTHETGFQQAIKRGAQRAGIGKRVKVHTLRHSFATHFLEGRGDLTVLQRLLGHKYLETTSIYLHCLPSLVTGARSPLDDLGGGTVLPFAQPPAGQMRSASAF
jgi:integron integrase